MPEERAVNKQYDTVDVIDSHTGGEPTRVVIAGGPELGNGTMAERLAVMRDEHDAFRSAVVNEPRGSDVLIGAMLCEPVNRDAAAGVVFFNNVAYLGMCGHGSIGLAVTLAHMGRIGIGEHIVETAAGDVTLTLLDDHTVSVSNVASYRHLRDATVDVPGIGLVTGDVAWGGNWFFLVSDHGQTISMENCRELTDYTWRIRQALDASDIRGADGAIVNHIELFGPASDTALAESRNFVLCPGAAYDRSPCGTGTSAKVACLIADGKLAPGAVWRQQSITGSVFEATASVIDGVVYPVITGTAFVTGESKLLFEPGDPFREGIGQ